MSIFRYRVMYLRLTITLQVGQRLTSTSNPAIGVLNLETITPKDQGDYQCRATYLGIGTIVSDPATLTVLGFLETLADMDLTKGMF